ncbi:class I SAM-dependent rRNA methyltransferase [Paramaledivibacter caminithermalis]|uniref:23S rRNA (Cytosine1962-C5)-methyltransferase n=1 Tax=Paramaledivibacter caminithermalis (strain DSM 15212 / CIP 107654 / DViRD3) TaxID=1121301 RepID=A0A1M6TF64_PARC5|nr:class I SAM-dependent rRNA methyltransferase [Paramaledivibacter caminithermalis]SHK55408.1 23S rRNA (cytosine1962-C5)-methyltransferase [Paramaledivibacter caminithermalis DSM 15212]
MKKEISIRIKQRFVNKFKNGYPLILKEAIINTNDLEREGVIVKLVDEKNKFIARGYYGKQNKGYGWILSRKENTKIDESFFEKKIISALNKRASFYNNPETTAFRVFNGEGDGIGGLTIDYYDGYYLINWYSKGIYKFRDYVINLLKRVVGFKGIYQKKRFDTQGKYIEEDGFILGERGQFPIIVKENGVNFAVYLNEGAMVGVFLDQRDVRRTIRDKYSKGKTVLNTFSYTGAFSVFAALGGARRTTSVDLANRSLSKTIEQFSINGIDYQAHDIIVEDVFNYFKYAVKKNLKFDMVILDPPSFAKSRNYRFSVAKDYKNLLKEAIAITENNGVIIASTNCSSFGMKKFKGFIDTAFKERHSRYKFLEEFSLPPDFRTIKEFEEGNYLKVVFIKKIK